MERIEPQTIEEKVRYAAYMAMHAMTSTTALEILASIAISGRRLSDKEIDNMVAARARSEEAFQQIRSKIDDILTIGEQLRNSGGGEDGQPRG